MKYSPGNDKRYWEDHGQNKGWNNEAMGKWAIIQCSDNTLYWCYGDNGDPDRFGSRKGLWLDNRGYIETWSRVFYCYQVDADYDHVRFAEEDCLRLSRR